MTNAVNTVKTKAGLIHQVSRRLVSPNESRLSGTSTLAVVTGHPPPPRQRRVIKAVLALRLSIEIQPEKQPAAVVVSMTGARSRSRPSALPGSALLGHERK